MDQEVWVLFGKSLVMRPVAQIRITHEPKVQKLTGRLIGEGAEQRAELIPSGGVKIEYLLGVREEFNSKGIRNSIGYEWYNEKDVATTKEELIGRL